MDYESGGCLVLEYDPDSKRNIGEFSKLKSALNFDDLDILDTMSVEVVSKGRSMYTLKYKSHEENDEPTFEDDDFWLREARERVTYTANPETRKVYSDVCRMLLDEVENDNSKVYVFCSNACIDNLKKMEKETVGKCNVPFEDIVLSAMLEKAFIADEHAMDVLERVSGPFDYEKDDSLYDKAVRMADSGFTNDLKKLYDKGVLKLGRKLEKVRPVTNLVPDEIPKKHDNVHSM